MPRRDNSQTITLDQYKAAQAAKDMNTLRSTGTDMSAHASQPESQACVPSNPCQAEFVCSRHRPTRRA